MAITWQKVKARTALAIGATGGEDVSTRETNYLAAMSTSNVDDPDWAPTSILDACIESAMEIAADLIEAEHPEADTFNVASVATASGSALPTTSSGSVPRIGRIWRVKDSTTNRSLLRTDVARVRDFINASSTVFSGLTPHWYAEDGAVLLHTRANVICEFGGFTRASITVNIGGSDVIPLTDRHENAIVAGAICKVAQHEGRLMDLAAKASAEYQAHRMMIRNWRASTSEGEG